MVGIRAELPRIADLEAQYSGTLSLSLDIVNASLIRADLEGDCGEQVVTAIRVGTGSREVTVRKQGGAKARVDLGALGNVETGGGRDRGEAESLAWAQPQGWSIEIGEGNRGMDDIRISMPEQVTANVPFGVEVDVGRAFWLVVLYRDADGDHDVIAPRGQYKADHVEGKRVALPDMTSTDHEGLDPRGPRGLRLRGRGRPPPPRAAAGLRSRRRRRTPTRAICKRSSTAGPSHPRGGPGPSSPSSSSPGTERATSERSPRQPPSAGLSTHASEGDAAISRGSTPAAVPPGSRGDVDAGPVRGSVNVRALGKDRATRSQEEDAV